MAKQRTFAWVVFAAIGVFALTLGAAHETERQSEEQAEDPRLDRFMAAPPRRSGAKAANRTHVTYPAEAGNVILFESWLRHEVPSNRVDAERISISFNFNWR